MTKKKSDKGDLTRIEDMSEFEHLEDSDLDMQFDTLSSSDEDDLSAAGLDISTLGLSDLDEETPPVPDLPEEFLTEEILPEAETEADDMTFSALPTETVDDFSSEFSSDNQENSFDDIAFSADSNTNSDNDILPDIAIGNSEEFLQSPPTVVEEVYTNNSEKFEDIKTFAQNFSYGKTTLTGGNPPYTIIARHIKFKEDADSILNIIEEFGVINEHNKKDINRSIELGSLIIPQISEYTAIVLAHKLRRFDLDLQVGLSDEVHPSKSGEINPKGLLKKENLKQNRSESLKFAEIEGTIQDIIVSTTPLLPGHTINHYIGVETTFSIIEESELERLEYVEKARRDRSELFEYNTSEETLETTEATFKNYRNSFSLIYNDLTTQLKQKAFAQKANALLGVTFQLAPLHFERAQTRVNAYQITCSATLAVISKENH